MAYFIIAPDGFKDLLTHTEVNPLEHNIKGYQEYKYLRCWKINIELFTCFLVIHS